MLLQESLAYKMTKQVESYIELDFTPPPIPEPEAMEENQTPEELTNEAQDLTEENIIDEDFEPVSKTLEEIMAERAEAQANDLENISDDGLAPASKGTGKQSSGGKTKTETKKAIKSGPSGRSSRSSFITYRVMYRKCVVDPNPVYLCEKNGTIVLNVWVNKKGRVTRAEVNPTLSAPYDKCMWETAVEFAKKTRFTEYKYAGNEQGGSITYQFQGQ